MRRFLLKRVLLVLPVLGGLLVLTFILVRVVAKDPAAALAGDNATVQQIEQIRVKYGFDRSLPEQFLIYVKQVATGDLGTSFYTMRPVSDEVLARLPATLELTTVALLLATLLGIPLGTIAAVYHNKFADHLIRLISVAGLALASFWLALMAQMLFSMHWDILPLRGRIGIFGSPPPHFTGSYLIDALLAGDLGTFLDAVKHILMPAATLGFGALAPIIRFTRSGVLETLQKDFVLYETAVGIPKWRLIGVFVLRNSLVATVNQIGLLFGTVIAGAVVIESIFDWPGIGTYVANAILINDYQATLAVTLVVGVIYAIVNIIVDLVHALLDPRVADQM
jgi:peptide/nickel transport system permease protein